MGAYRAVGARLRPVVGVLLPQALSLGCCNVETSTGFCNLRSLRKILDYLEYGGHVCRWRGEDFMAVVVQDELVLEVPRSWWRSAWWCNPGVANFVGVEVVFSPKDGLIIGPALGAESVVAKAICSMLIVLAVVGVDTVF